MVCNSQQKTQTSRRVSSHELETRSFMVVQLLKVATEMQKSRRITENALLRAISLVLLLCAEAATSILGAPIRGPDLNNCLPVIAKKGEQEDPLDCCLLDRPKKQFKFDSDQPKRIRRPAHKLDQEYIEKYKKAYELLRALPDDDPRSWWQQSNVHCTYCSGAYPQFNSTEILDVHGGWLLMPFHRWYGYFHERILGSLIGDDTFALPYWAWDVQNDTSNMIPDVYRDETSPLYDVRRSPVHQPPERADLDFRREDLTKNPAELLSQNYYNMWRVMISDTKTPATFYGGKYSEGDPPNGRAGVFELGPHAAMHKWTGDDDNYGLDMGPPYASARDPLFFAHHGQVDRLWMIWQELGGQDHDDPDWLDAEFVFYDENADLVRVNVRDSLDLANFNIEYELVVPDWLDYVPDSIRTNNPELAKPGFLGRWRRSLSQVLAGEKSLATVLRIYPQESGQNLILKGRATLTSDVSLPTSRAKRSMLKSEVASVVEEVLVIEGVMTKPFDITVRFGVFIDLPEADQSKRRDCTESLGTFFLDAVGRKGNDNIIRQQFTHEFCIGDRLKLLGLRGSSSVEITFVPLWNAMDDDIVAVEFSKVAVELHKVK